MIPTGNSAEPTYAYLLAAIGTVALAVLAALALRRAPADPEKPRRLSALAGFGFWLAMLSFGLMSAGFLILTLIQRAPIFEVDLSEAGSMLVGATVVGICAAAAAGLSTLLSVAAIASARGNGRYGIGLAALSLFVCAVVLAGTYLPKVSLNAQVDQIHRSIK